MTATANELLLPALLAMDGYHRNVVGALSAQLEGEIISQTSTICMIPTSSCGDSP